MDVGDVRRRLPGVGRLVVQVDEPLLGQVLRGELPTASGWGRVRAVEEPVAEALLRRVLAAGGDVVGVRSTTAPVGLARRSGAWFFGVDAATLASLPDDDLGEALEAGMGLLVALLPPAAGATAEPGVLLEPLRALWERLGLAWDLLPRAVAVTPLEGLERLDPAAAATTLRRCVEVGRFLVEAAGDEEW